jgi:prophage antirepressor-like protein
MKSENQPCNSHLDILQHFIFDNTEFEVTILWENGNPLFKALDIGKILELKKIRNTLLSFDSDERVTAHTMGSLGGNQKTIMLTELGLYRL